MIFILHIYITTVLVFSSLLHTTLLCTYAALLDTNKCFLQFCKFFEEEITDIHQQSTDYLQLAYLITKKKASF